MSRLWGDTPRASTVGDVDAGWLRALIAGGETERVEFKVAPPRAADLATRICGFANGAGGDVVLGVADRTWALVGVRDSAAAVDLLLQACRHCKPPVRLDPPQPTVARLDGRDLVVGHIPPNDGTLHQAGGAFYIRRGTHTVPLDAAEIERYFHARGTLAWEARPAPLATLADLDLDRVRAYLAHRPGRRGAAPDAPDPATLRRIGCAVADPADPAVVRPTHAGLLLFGRVPQDTIMHAEVICVLFGDDLGLRRYLDRRILHGTLPEQIDQAEEFLVRHMRVGARTDGFRRVDEPDYPLEALREAVVNAVVHRDYSLAGEAARLFYYPDRIEVHSPGLLPPGIRLDDLRAGRVPSRPRNPLLASLLRDVPGGYMERVGSGVVFMIGQMRALGRPEPEFREQGEVLVTFRHGVEVVGAPTRGAGRGGTVTAKTVTVAGREGTRGPTTSERQEIALRHVRAHGAITNKVYRTLVGVSNMTALRDLDALVARGSLHAVGQGRGRKYVR